MKVALVHDYLSQRGGAERVFLSMCRAFPEAEVFASLYEPDLTFPEFAELNIRTTSVNRSRLLRQNHRLALPFLATTFSRLEIDADMTICSSSGWAHGVRTRGTKVVYCHNPARWLYQTDQYTGRPGSVTTAAIRAAGGPLRQWDRRAARSADAYLANSQLVRQRVRGVYGIDAAIVHPPINIDPAGKQTPIERLRDGFFLCVSRLVHHKNVDAIIDAFTDLPNERLVVVGCGPMERQLRSALPSNVELVGTVSEPELRWLYAHCQALLAASYEDFGLTPVEAMAFGKPSVVLRYGGFLETVTDGETGVFFDEPTGPAIAGAVGRLQHTQFTPGLLRTRAEGYTQAGFEERLHSAIASVAGKEIRATSTRGARTA